MLYDSSIRISSSCFGDTEGGHQFLTVVSKIAQSGPMMLKCGDYTDQPGKRLKFTFISFKP
jgi:hypothetical protein